MNNIDFTQPFRDIIETLVEENTIVNKKIIQWFGYEKMILNGLCKQLELNNISFKYVKNNKEHYIIVNTKDLKKYLMTLDTNIGENAREYFVNK